MVDGVSSLSSGIRWRQRHYFRETEPSDGAAGLPSKCDTLVRFGTNLPGSYWLSEHKAETKGHGDMDGTVRSPEVILISQCSVRVSPAEQFRQVSRISLNRKSTYFSTCDTLSKPRPAFGLGRGDKYRVKKTSKYRVWKLAAAIMLALLDLSSYLSLRDDVHVLVNAGLLLFSWNEILHCHYSLYCRRKIVALYPEAI